MSGAALEFFGFRFLSMSSVTKPSDAAPLQEKVLKGILFMCLAVSLFPVMNAAVKYLSTDYSITQIVWARYAGHFIYMVIAFMPRYGRNLFYSVKPGIQAMRSLLAFGSTTIYFTALGYISLPMAAAISFVSPFFVTALAGPVLGEQVGWRRWLAVAAGFTGALIIIRPGAAGFHWAMLLPVMSAFCYGLYQLLTRKISAADSPETTILYTAFVGLAVISVIAPFDWRWPPMDGDGAWDIVLFLSLGFFGGFGHYCVVKALQFGPAAVIAPFTYGQLVGATLFGFILFGDFPDFWVWVGAALIVGSGIFITWRESRVRQLAPKNTA